MDTKKIVMLSDETGADGESLEKGKVYTLNAASADRWLRRGKAETAEDKKAKEGDKKKPDETTGAAVDGDIKRESPAVVGTTENVFTKDEPVKAKK